MSNLTWRLGPKKNGVVPFKLSGGTPAEEIYVLGLVMQELGTSATVTPSGESYYNYKITLHGETDRGLRAHLWGFLMHRHGIPVILY